MCVVRATVVVLTVYRLLVLSTPSNPMGLDTEDVNELPRNSTSSPVSTKSVAWPPEKTCWLRAPQFTPVNRTFKFTISPEVGNTMLFPAWKGSAPDRKLSVTPSLPAARLMLAAHSPDPTVKVVPAAGVASEREVVHAAMAPRDGNTTIPQNIPVTSTVRSEEVRTEIRERMLLDFFLFLSLDIFGYLKR